jgi:hypothetical protein
VGVEGQNTCVMYVCGGGGSLHVMHPHIGPCMSKGCVCVEGRYRGMVAMLSAAFPRPTQNHLVVVDGRNAADRPLQSSHTPGAV